MGRWAAAVGLSVGAAFGWATYYLFILKAGPATAPSAALVYPFVVGGAAYAVWSVSRGEGRELVRLFATGPAWSRTGLMVAVQVTVLASTYLTGPVDASLLSLLGDVVATPLLVLAWSAGERRPYVSLAFVAGLALSLVGGSLAIAGGAPLATIPPLGWVAVPALPVAVAFYFVMTARARGPGHRSDVVAQTIVGAAIVCLAITPVVPGGFAGLVRVAPLPLLLLAVNGVVSFFLAPLAYFRAIAEVGLVLPPVLMTGMPVFTLLLSAAFLGIVPTWIALLGIPVAILGGVVTLRSESRGAPASPTASR